MNSIRMLRAGTVAIGGSIAGSAGIAFGEGGLSPFTDEAVARGIVYVPNEVGNLGQGVLFSDLDGDGDPDVVTLGDTAGTVGVFENDGEGFFSSHTATSGIGLVLDQSAIAAGDYDRDGDLDLYITSYGNANLLMRNDGGFQFVDVAATAGVADTGNGAGPGWGDYDNDGWLDLYLANFEHTNRLFRNLGDGTFEEVATALGVDRGLDPTFQGSFFDFDRDADADIYLATDRGSNCATAPFQNYLYENLGGTFADITEASGTEACVDAMSIALGDFDRNGWMDIYCTNTPPGNALLMNQGDGTFLEEAELFGVAVYEGGWGADFFDFDNDSHLDLYVCNQVAPNRLFRHEGVFPCGDVGPSLGVASPGFSYTVATADIDGDGDLDLLLHDRFQNIHLYVNHEGQKRNWAKFDTIGEGANRYAVGSLLDICTGPVRQVRELVAGHNYKSQNDLVQHVGLDTASMMDSVTVTWIGGTTRTLQNLAANETWTLYPPDKLGDGDQDGDRDLDDFLAFEACFTGDLPGSLTPGCEMMDYEGDGDVDLLDFDQFLLVYEGVLEDCNDNGIQDLIEILDGSAPDDDDDGLIDSCSLVGDIDGDGIVGFTDLLNVLTNWGPCLGCPADVDGDGDVDLQDLLLVLSNWT